MRRGLLAAAAALAALGSVPLASAAIDVLHPSPAGRLALQAVASSTLLAGLAVAGAALSRRRMSERLGLEPGRLGARGILAAVVGLLFLSHGLEAVLRVLELRDTGTLAHIDAVLRDLPPRQLTYALVGLGLAPGFAEELFFRGLVQRGLERALGGLAAVLVAALAFGALHLDPVHAAAAFGLGLYLGCVALWDGGIRAAVACHVANNVVAVLEASAGWFPDLPGEISAAVGLGGAIAALWWVRRDAAAETPAVPPAAGPGGSVMGGEHPVGELVADEQRPAQQDAPERQR